jgi:hypothetical protein
LDVVKVHQDLVEAVEQIDRLRWEIGGQVTGLIVGLIVGLLIGFRHGGGIIGRALPLA